MEGSLSSLIATIPAGNVVPPLHHQHYLHDQHFLRFIRKGKICLISTNGLCSDCVQGWLFEYGQAAMNDLLCFNPYKFYITFITFIAFTTSTTMEGKVLMK